MRITCYATIFSILYALVCGTQNGFSFRRKQSHITLNKISNDVKCLEDIRISGNTLNNYGKFACLKAKANKQQNIANKKFNFLNPFTVVYNYNGVNFRNQPDGSILLKCHVPRPAISLINHWYVVVAWEQKTDTCTVLGAEVTQRYGPPQVCATANEPSKKYKFTQLFSGPLRANRHKNQHH
ncbi:hypothetical protein GcM3_212036 [Golovinomyces cichoracearum]|uniref:Secreted effector protein n=1 Tax=Golovinomyces cichoracearum TaxID=62708 RepID=A0A420H9L9_9PEZI|nr:hypothetical protein GcM3_212036 [Golovinomyces cichoracearum]